MHRDKFGQYSLTENDILDMYMSNIENTPRKIIVESLNFKFNPDMELDYYPVLEENFDGSGILIPEFDEVLQDIWLMPDHYKSFDIEHHIIDLCNDHDRDRVLHELMLYKEKNMLNLLRYCKYFTDTMKKNKLLWGVGRGSSVSSYILYLLGIHKINSLKYNLDITDFLKD